MKKHFSVKALFWKAWLLASILGLFGVTVALAASGDLDTTFHGTGKYKLDIVSGQSSLAVAVAIQSDGKIVTVGYTLPSGTNENIAVARFTKSGALDTTFNSTGKKVIDLGGIDQGTGVVIDPATGKIILAGNKCSIDWTTCNAAVVRLNPDGSLDTTFHGTGKVITGFGGGNRASSVALSGNKIVIAGYMFNKTTGHYNFAVYRYASTGALDTTFNGSGKKAISFGAGQDSYAYSLIIQPGDGKIVVAGTTLDSKYNFNFALARLNPDGSLDTTFNRTGKVITDFGAYDWAYGLALQSNGKIVAVGDKESSSASYFALARYNANGSLDITFAGTGKKVLDFSGGDSFAHAVRVQSSTGEIVVCGGSKGNFALARFTSGGVLDTTFHGTGKVSIDFGGDDGCFGLAIQPADGKYVLVGHSNDGTRNHWAVARVLP